MATAMPISTRTGGCSQPCCAEYLRKKIAAMTMAMPEIAGNSLAPARLSQSNDGAGGSDGSDGAGGCGTGGIALDGNGGAAGGRALSTRGADGASISGLTGGCSTTAWG